MAADFQRLVGICRQRGFFIPSAEIHGGLRGCFDYGPLGASLKRNIENVWWKSMIGSRSNIFPMDACILGPAPLWKASGHVSHFSDKMSDCLLSGIRFRVDHAPPVRISNDPQYGPCIQILADNPSLLKQWKALIQGPNILGPESLVIERKKSLTLPLQQAPENDASELTFVSSDGKPLPWHYYGFVQPTSNSPFVMPPRDFNLMFQTSLGAVSDREHLAKSCLDFVTTFQHENGRLPNEDELKKHMLQQSSTSSTVYLRPELAQSAFVNYQTIQRTMASQLPMGIAHIGRSFRNEIRTDHALFRMPEFEQMEMQFFVAPEAAKEWTEYWVHERLKWWQHIIGSNEKVRIRQHEEDELAHYAKECFDIEVLFPWGWGEVEGIANRGSYDLQQHMKASGTDLEYFDEQPFESHFPEKKSYATGKPDGERRRFIPHVVETSAGLSRAILAVLSCGFQKNVQKRNLMKLNPLLAPYKLAIFPLSNDEKLVATAKQLYDNLLKSDLVSGALSSGFQIKFDASSRSIGKKYARHDEVGTVWCATVDFETIGDGSVENPGDQKVTIRDRDTGKQERIPMESLETYFSRKLKKVAW